MIRKRSSSNRNSLTEDELDTNENSPIIKRISLSRKKSYKKWTKEEDERLRDFINSRNDLKDWSSISKHVGNGRTDAQCQHRWECFLDPSITKGSWTDEEDKKVIELVRDYGARQWSIIAKELRGRVGKQCRERWHNHLNPLINKNPWTNEENLRLFILHQHFGNRWAEIARYFNGRSDNSIKNHWNSSLKKKFHLEVENFKKQGLEWTALIPSGFPWPKLDKSISVITNRSSRIPLSTITNQARSSNITNTTIEDISSPSSIVKTESYTPIMNSNHHQFHSTTNHIDFDITSTVYPDQLPPITSSQDLEHLFYYTPPSPVKQLPMLSSCANYTPPRQNSLHHSVNHPLRSSSSAVFSCSSILSTDTNLFSNDDSFIIKYNENLIVSSANISNTSSPAKSRALNTPERSHLIRLTPSPKQDWFNEYLPLSEPENHSSVCLNKYDLLNHLQEKLGYNPTYTEILIGQTRDQCYITDLARRYLSCSLLNNS